MRLCVSLNSNLLVPAKELAQVPEVVAPHLHVEHLGVSLSGVGNQVVLEQAQHGPADLVQLVLNLLAVPLDQVEVLAAFVFFFVLNGRNGAPSRPSRRNCVLKSDTEEVSLFIAELALLKSQNRVLPEPRSSCS